MTTPPRELDRIQRWMQAVITHPGGVLGGIRSDEARREINVTPDGVESVVRPSRSQTSLERLQVYADAYYARLLECLRDEYPALLHAAGPKAFDGFAFGYLQAYPSRSYTLARLGENFPKFLAETRPEIAEFPEPGWPDFLIDLARLERAYAEVFHGPGIEGKRTLRADDLAAIPHQRWGEVRLKPAGSLRLMSFRFPVHEYATAVRNGESPAPPDVRPTFLAIARRDYVVRRHELSPLQYGLLNGLVAGAPLGAAVAETFHGVGGSVEDHAADLRRWFEAWAAAQYFEGVT